MVPSGKIRALHHEVIVLTAYALLTLIGTYPLILRVGQAIPLSGDSWQNYWNLSWVKKALLEQHVNPYFTTDVYFPYGTTLYFHTLNLLPAVIALPVAKTLGVIAAFYFLTFLSFVLSGYGTYRLALYVLRASNAKVAPDSVTLHFAAFISGVAFAFSSYRYIHLLGHLDLLSTQWLPLFVLFLIKARDEDGWLNVAAASFFLAAAMLTSPYYMLFLLVFTGLVVAALILTTKGSSRVQVLRTCGPSCHIRIPGIASAHSHADSRAY